MGHAKKGTQPASGKRVGRTSRLVSWCRVMTGLAACILAFLFAANVSSLSQYVYSWPYREAVYRQCEVNHLDAELVFSVIYSESRFRADAESAAGARGLMQIMPETGAWIADHMGIEDYHAERLFEPELNLAMGTWYMSWLEQQFDREPAQVLAAYNAGPGNVKKWIDADIWDGSQQKLEDIPFYETRNYVQRVLRQYTNHQKYAAALL